MQLDYTPQSTVLDFPKSNDAPSVDCHMASVMAVAIISGDANYLISLICVNGGDRRVWNIDWEKSRPLTASAPSNGGYSAQQN